MCSFSDGDGCEVWRETNRKARKPHRCDECRAAILVGATYVSHFSKYEGDVTTGKLCGSCDWIRARFAEKHDGMLFPPGSVARYLADCISDGDEDSEKLWRPMLDAINARRVVNAQASR